MVIEVCDGTMEDCLTEAYERLVRHCQGRHRCPDGFSKVRDHVYTPMECDTEATPRQ